MSDALTTFFDAWSETDATKRSAMIAASTTPQMTYSDPRSGARLVGHDDISEYVGMGPDGTEMTQHGTYFSEADDAGKLLMIAGFVGLGYNADV